MGDSLTYFFLPVNSILQSFQAYQKALVTEWGSNMAKGFSPIDLIIVSME